MIWSQDDNTSCFSDEIDLTAARNNERNERKKEPKNYNLFRNIPILVTQRRAATFDEPSHHANI